VLRYMMLRISCGLGSWLETPSLLSLWLLPGLESDETEFKTVGAICQGPQLFCQLLETAASFVP